MAIFRRSRISLEIRYQRCPKKDDYVVALKTVANKIPKLIQLIKNIIFKYYWCRSDLVLGDIGHHSISNRLKKGDIFIEWIVNVDFKSKIKINIGW